MKLFVDNLTHVDFSYLHPERGLVGESWDASVVLDGGLDDQGMICDFGVVKKRMKQWLDSHVDHLLLVPTLMPGVAVVHEQGRVIVDWQYADGRQFQCRAPEQAIALLPVAEINQKTVALWCQQQLLELFPQQVRAVELAFCAEAIEGAFYHYSHGLQQHQGNCQRIAHGHRSRIEIRLDGKRRQDVERFWAEAFADIYLGTRAHLQPEPLQGHYRFAYEAPQGHFELLLPQQVCYLMETETTVERIAAHLAEQIAAEYPHTQVCVRAYEGPGKGAIAECEV